MATITNIKSVEQAQNIISRKLGVDLNDLLYLISASKEELTFDEWKNLANWCESYEGSIPYRMFSVYIKTMNIR